MRLILLVTAAMLALCSSASANSLSYTFDRNNQGWIQTQNASTGPFPSAGFQATGGSPDGHLTAQDSGPETGCPSGNPCQLLTFYSPIVATLGANYGGSGSFDLRSRNVDPAFAAELLLLAAGDNYLDGVVPETIGTTYHHLSIPLNEAANWRACPYLGGDCSAPSQADFKSLIGSADGIAVMVDVGPNGTGETYDLDNVTLTDGTPATPAPVTPAPPTKKKCKKKHRRAVKKSKRCKKRKHPRAAVVRIRG